MTLAVHASVGMLVGRLTKNPLLGFLAGVVSHFLLDMIPHGDEYMLRNYQEKKDVSKSVAYVLIDTAITVGMIILMFTQGIFSRSFAGAMGALGAIVPDILVGLHEAIPKKSKLLAQYVKFHHHNHHILIKKLFRERDIRHTWALVYQGIFVAAFLSLIIK